MTDANAKLWSRLRDGRLLGTKFRRQVPIGSFIADFCCRNPRLVVEVDGGQHAEHAAHDEARTRVIAEDGYTVLRFWNDDVGRSIALFVLRPFPKPAETPYTCRQCRLQS